MEILFSWNGLFKVFIVLIAVYYIAKLLGMLVLRSVSKPGLYFEIKRDMNHFLFAYKVFSAVIIALGFFKAAPIVQLLLILFIGYILINYLKSYLIGLRLKENPKFKVGVEFSCGVYQGYIESILPQGIYIRQGYLKVFLNYSEIILKGYKLAHYSELPS
ncbi:hypothetical protein [Ulvibacter antarcticus]|uniref:Uncharacterized protein n=1 Tax=Ulvibacter antarcticus TaxID=442714 RepID=A0A3L9YGD5_9FLAO|nr:hypothetical protein [Ulvibacter antarcticus]RMA58597.1 hypothetical protein BXY75_1970 [Ulvibacter antarcticus]